VKVQAGLAASTGMNTAHRRAHAYAFYEAPGHEHRLAVRERAGLAALLLNNQQPVPVLIPEHEEERHGAVAAH
jgi:hypothetical protein